MRTEIAAALPFAELPEQDHRRAARARVRLEPTRRGRRLAVVLAFLLGLVVAAAALLTLDLAAASAGDEPSAPATVTVQSGDTLWELAQDHAPAGMDEQEFITEVRILNGLSTPRVTAGQELRLPESAEGAR